jgi:hypothetical protein
MDIGVIPAKKARQLASETCSRRASEHRVHKPSVSFMWASALEQPRRSTRKSTDVDYCWSNLDSS